MKVNIFVGSDISGSEFANIMIDLQKQGWFTPKDVVEKFFSNIASRLQKISQKNAKILSSIELSYEPKSRWYIFLRILGLGVKNKEIVSINISGRVRGYQENIA